MRILYAIIMVNKFASHSIDIDIKIKTEEKKTKRFVQITTIWFKK